MYPSWLTKHIIDSSESTFMDDLLKPSKGFKYSTSLFDSSIIILFILLIVAALLTPIFVLLF